MRCVLMLLLAAALACALPAIASASRSQFTMIEAARAQERRPSVRDTTFDDGVLRRDWIRVILYWQTSPDPDRRSEPRVDQTDPAAFPPGGGRRMTGCRRGGARHPRAADRQRPGPAPGDVGAAAREFPARCRFGRFVQAVGRRYGQQINYCSVWNEPDHPHSSGPSGCAASRMPRGSTDACPRGTQGVAPVGQSS